MFRMKFSLVSLLIFCFCIGFSQEKVRKSGANLQIESEQLDIKPLDNIWVYGPDSGTIVVRDANGDEYIREPSSTHFSFRVSGALGTHTITLLTSEGKFIENISFNADCKTSIKNSSGEWDNLMRMLEWNIHKGREHKVTKYEGRTYFLFSDWLRDHVHILKGKKYFAADRVKDAIDLFGKTQQKDGMIFDFYMPHDPQQEGTEYRFHDLKYIEVVEDGHYMLERVPVENDVEYLFVEGLYYTWKATGDSYWMKKWLSAAEKALEYSINDPLRWSMKFELLKRGFTIDTWDFQPKEDAQRVGGDVMDIVEGKTQFGIMHGDNTGYAASCRYLAEMLAYTGQVKKAKMWNERSNKILKKLEEVAWNGRFYQHFVPEDKSIVRDLGVDKDEQVSLSNTYALNRGIEHEKAVAIIETYQTIREEMPETSPGEFYGIYPPFKKGFGYSTKPWHYVNGGVFPFIAGELAHGAFEHGYEDYGVDILRRIKSLLESHEEQLPYFWLGKIPESPERTFQKLDLKSVANVDFSGKGAPDVPGWTGQGVKNDLSIMPAGEKVFHDIPFSIINPAENSRKACVGLAGDQGYYQSIDVTVNKKAESLYFLHTLAGSGLAGWIDFHYKDGTTWRKYVNSGRQVKNWWNPSDVPYNRKSGWTCRVAWEGKNDRTKVGVYIWGMDNPFPEKEIKKLTFNHSLEANKWFVLGITLSDKYKYFKPQDACYGWLSNWNAAGVTYALVEGLAGIYDKGICYDKIRLAPRWSAAGVKHVVATAKYENSGGYVRYDYLYDPSKNVLKIDLASVAIQGLNIDILLPERQKPVSLYVNEEMRDYDVQMIEESGYVSFNIEGSKDVQTIRLNLSPQ